MSFVRPRELVSLDPQHVAMSARASHACNVIRKSQSDTEDLSLAYASFNSIVEEREKESVSK